MCQAQMIDVRAWTHTAMPSVAHIRLILFALWMDVGTVRAVKLIHQDELRPTGWGLWQPGGNYTLIQGSPGCCCLVWWLAMMKIASYDNGEEQLADNDNEKHWISRIFHYTRCWMHVTRCGVEDCSRVRIALIESIAIVSTAKSGNKNHFQHNTVNTQQFIMSAGSAHCSWSLNFQLSSVRIVVDAS